jgi:hypothetical protein
MHGPKVLPLSHLPTDTWGATIRDIMHPSSVPAAMVGGLAMGVLHVLSGADHISAVATLACGKNKTKAFYLGVRWGIGHSVG